MSYYEENAEKTRTVGNCPVCEGDYRLRDGKLVHHGYKRPGDGEIHGDCFGVGYPAYELSSFGCEIYLETVNKWRTGAVEHLKNLESGEITEVHVEKYRGYGKRPELVKLYADSADPNEVRDFENALRNLIAKTKRQIATYDFERKRMEGRIANWAPTAVKTFEEHEAAKRTAPERLKAQADRQAKRDAKAEKARLNEEKKQRYASEKSALLEHYRAIFASCSRSEAPAHWRAMVREQGRKGYLGFYPYELKMPDRLIELGLAQEEQRAHGSFVQYADRDGRLPRLEPNASYYVWVIGRDHQPLDEGPYGPHDLEGAKTFARIAATEGNHDRAVSRGRDPKSASFEVVRRYRAGSGERVI